MPTTDDVKASYVRLSKKFYVSEREFVDEDLASARAKVDRLSKELVLAVREVHDLRNRAKALTQLSSSSLAEFEHDYESILALPLVARLEVDGSTITIFTDPVILEHDRHSYLIGEFALDIDLEGSIEVRNLSNTIKRGGWEHPHVQGGSPCLGNIRDGLMKLLGDLELVPLASMLLQFLGAYDQDTAYCEVAMWEEIA